MKAIITSKIYKFKIYLLKFKDEMEQKFKKLKINMVNYYQCGVLGFVSNLFSFRSRIQLT